MNIILERHFVLGMCHCFDTNVFPVLIDIQISLWLGTLNTMISLSLSLAVSYLKRRRYEDTKALYKVKSTYLQWNTITLKHTKTVTTRHRSALPPQLNALPTSPISLISPPSLHRPIPLKSNSFINLPFISNGDMQ